MFGNSVCTVCYSLVLLRVLGFYVGSDKYQAPPDETIGQPLFPLPSGFNYCPNPFFTHSFEVNWYSRIRFRIRAMS